MHMCFDVHTIKGKIYKKLIQDLCQISDNIFFTSDREYTVDEEGIHGVEGECERVNIPSDVKKWCNGAVNRLPEECGRILVILSCSM